MRRDDEQLTGEEIDPALNELERSIVREAVHGFDEQARERILRSIREAESARPRAWLGPRVPLAYAAAAAITLCAATWAVTRSAASASSARPGDIVAPAPPGAEIDRHRPVPQLAVVHESPSLDIRGWRVIRVSGVVSKPE